MVVIFVSASPGTYLVRGGGQDLYDQRGQLVQKGARHLSVELRRGFAPTRVAEAAAQRFRYRPVPVPTGGNRPLEDTVPWYDSEADPRGLSDEEREAIEQYLSSEAPGVVPVDEGAS
jgi:hypothetical protein